jgi:hypothetical protein
LVAGEQSGLDSFLGGGSDELDAADEDTGELTGSWMDRKRQDGIDEGTWNDVKEAAAFLEPGVALGFEHGVGFVAVQALGHERVLKVVAKRIERAAGRRGAKSG